MLTIQQRKSKLECTRAQPASLCTDLGPPDGCERGRAPAAAAAPCPGAPDGAAESCKLDGLLVGVNDRALTFSLNSLANGFSFDLAAAADGVVLLSLLIALPEHSPKGFSETPVSRALLCACSAQAPNAHCASMTSSKLVCSSRRVRSSAHPLLFSAYGLIAMLTNLAVCCVCTCIASPFTC